MADLKDLIVQGTSRFIGKAYGLISKAECDANGDVISSTYLKKTDASSGYLPLTGGTMTGPIKWNATSLTQDSNGTFVCTIDAFNSGGQQHWCPTSALSVAKAVKMDYPEGFSSRNSNMTWGTLTTANGYTQRTCWASSAGGAVGFADSGSQTYMQIDGFYYQNEGKYRVLDTNNYSSTLGSVYAPISYTATVNTATGNIKTLSTNTGTINTTLNTATGNIKTLSSNTGTLNTNTATLASNTATLSSNFSKYVPLSGGTMTGDLILSGGTSTDMTFSGNVHPKITFANSSNAQRVSFIYTDYDTYRSPAGIKVVGEQGNEWFECGRIFGSAISGNSISSYTIDASNCVRVAGYVSAKTTSYFLNGLNITGGITTSGNITQTGNVYSNGQITASTGSFTNLSVSNTIAGRSQYADYANSACATSLSSNLWTSLYSNFVPISGNSASNPMTGPLYIATNQPIYFGVTNKTSYATSSLSGDSSSFNIGGGKVQYTQGSGLTCSESQNASSGNIVANSTRLATMGSVYGYVTAKIAATITITI